MVAGVVRAAAVAQRFAQHVGEMVPTVSEIRVEESNNEISAWVIMDGEEPMSDVDRVFRMELEFVREYPCWGLDTRVLSRRHHAPQDLESIIPPHAELVWTKRAR